MSMTPQAAANALYNVFGITVTPEMAGDALKELHEYNNLNFETLWGKYKVVRDTYILLAVKNTEMHNGAWQRYVDHLKTNYRSIIVQAVMNRRLRGWLVRNDFKSTRHDRDSFIWSKK